MLRTCQRCKRRRIKCDDQLPACVSCSRSDVECTFIDDVSNEIVSRSYIKTLYDKRDSLKAKLASKATASPGSFNADKQSIPSRIPLESNISTKSSELFHLHRSPPALIVSAITRSLNIAEWHGKPYAPESLAQTVPFASSARATISPKIINSLLSHYTSCIYPTYPLPLDLAKFINENLILDTLAIEERFKILISCTIGAVHRSYTQASWLQVAHICREWAGELFPFFYGKPGQNSLIAAVALLLYEVSEPSRGMLWELHDLAIRLCLEQGWHSFQNPEDRPSNRVPSSPVPSGGDASPPYPVLSVLDSINRSLRILFNRPSMLDSLILTPTVYEANVLKIHRKACIELFCFNHGSQNNHCVLDDALCFLAQEIEEISPTNSVIQETWLLFIAASMDHGICLACESRPADIPGSLQHLRARILKSAVDIITATYDAVIVKSSYEIPMFVSPRAFKAGCALVVAVQQGWAPCNGWPTILMKCTEIITANRVRWKGGEEYSDAWRHIYSALETFG